MEEIEFSPEEQKQKLNDALDILSFECNVMAKCIEAKVIPTMEYIDKLNKAADFVYFILNGANKK